MRVGGLDVDPQGAVEAAMPYLANDSEEKPYSYPWYDTYRTNDEAGRLVDGDLLAPVLLNAAPDITAYRTLVKLRLELEERLGSLCTSVPASDRPLPAGDARHELVGALYAPLVGRRGGHVSGTILAKVLHRKRPDVIPLYDERVRTVYQDAPAAPLPVQKGRGWPAFMTLLSDAISTDLERPGTLEVVDAVRAGARHGEITRLRAWDIVVWQAGRHPSARRATAG
jgi:hypothetical protein